MLQKLIDLKYLTTASVLIWEDAFVLIIIIIIIIIIILILIKILIDLPLFNAFCDCESLAYSVGDISAVKE